MWHKCDVKLINIFFGSGSFGAILATCPHILFTTTMSLVKFAAALSPPLSCIRTRAQGNRGKLVPIQSVILCEIFVIDISITNINPWSSTSRSIESLDSTAQTIQVLTPNESAWLGRSPEPRINRAPTAVGVKLMLEW